MDLSPSTSTLRPFKLSDTGDFLSWAGNDRVTRYFRWDSVASLEAAESYLRAIAVPHPWCRSICIGDHSIGYVFIKPGSSDEWCCAHDCYTVGAEFWGQGFATATLRMAACHVFDEMPELVRLEGFVEVEMEGLKGFWRRLGL